MSQAAYEREIPLPVILPPHPVVELSRVVRDVYWCRRATWSSFAAQQYVQHIAVALARQDPKEVIHV